MATAPSELVWSQDLQVHWPKSWRFLTGRDLLLEAFTPKIFSVEEDKIFVRYGENQDLRVSDRGLHLRILALGVSDKRAIEVMEQVLQIIQPFELTSLEARFAHVRALEDDYDSARRRYSYGFYGSWIRSRHVKDFALTWDERLSPDGEANFRAGIVNSEELVLRVAMASDMAEETLRRQMPAWMKVRMPSVAMFMESGYRSNETFDLDLGRAQVPQIWRGWRETSGDVFKELTGVEIPADRGELA